MFNDHYAKFIYEWTQHKNTVYMQCRLTYRKKHMLNLVNFGPQTEKNRTVVLNHPESTFSYAQLSGDKGCCPLKVKQMTNACQCIPSRDRWGCPDNFLAMKIYCVVIIIIIVWSVLKDADLKISTSTSVTSLYYNTLGLLRVFNSHWHILFCMLLKTWSIDWLTGWYLPGTPVL